MTAPRPQPRRRRARSSFPDSVEFRRFRSTLKVSGNPIVTKPCAKELPPLFRRHVRRPRLTQILDESSAQSILIIAPAGYGKTTLVAEWLQGTETANAWYRATNSSADVAAFSAGIAEVIRPLAPGIGVSLTQRLRVPEPPDRQARALAELLAKDLRAWPDDSLLVIDDYHLVMDSPTVEDFVDWLLVLSPIRIVMTSRKRPTWASARRVLYGEVVEIGREQLAMTGEEAARVFDDADRAPTRALLEKAEGWPAVIGLAALSASAELPDAEVSDALYRFFAEEFVRSEEPATRDILFSASVPPRLDRAYLNALAIDPDSFEAVLEGQAFLRELGERTLRLHPLLRAFLLEQMRETDPELLKRLHRVSLRVARDHAWWDEAFELAMQGHMADEAAEVVCAAGSAYLTEGRVETILKWLDLCDEPGRRLPCALLLRADSYLRLGRVLDAYLVACDLTNRLGAQDALTSRAWNLRGQASYWMGQDDRALEEHLKARDFAQSSHDQHEALWGAWLAASGMDRPSASDLLDELERAGHLSADTELRLAVGRCIMATRRGTVAGASERMDSAAGLLRQSTDPRVISSFLAHRAYAKISRGEYQEARDLAREASSHARTLMLALPLHACLGYEALAELGVRRFQAVRNLLPELRRLASQVRDPHPAIVTSIVSAKLDLMRGKQPREESPAQATYLSLQPSTAAEYLAVKALAAAVRGDRAVTEALTGEASGLSGSVETILYLRFADIILAAVEDPSADLSGPVGEAIRDADLRECIDAFILAYRVYPRLLKGAREASSVQAPVTRALLLATDHKLASEYGFDLGAETTIESVLTPRELEVLRLMAAGLSNGEIAEALVIARSTAKVHVHRVVRKLGVRTRLQAVLKFQAPES